MSAEAVLEQGLESIMNDIDLLSQAVAYVPGSHQFWKDAWRYIFHPSLQKSGNPDKILGANPREAVLRRFARCRFWHRDPLLDPPQIKEKEDEQLYGLFRQTHGIRWPDKNTFQ